MNCDRSPGRRVGLTQRETAAPLIRTTGEAALAFLLQETTPASAARLTHMS